MNYGEVLKMWQEIKEYIVSIFYEVDSLYYSYKMGIKEIYWRIMKILLSIVINYKIYG